MEKTKVTRVQMFKAIRERVLDNADMVAFLDHQIELIENKSSKKKPTANQEKNETIKAVILEVLGTDGITVTDLQKKDDRLSSDKFTNQKITSLLALLRADGKVDKKVEGKKTLYFLA